MKSMEGYNTYAEYSKTYKFRYAEIAAIIIGTTIESYAGGQTAKIIGDTLVGAGGIAAAYEFGKMALFATRAGRADAAESNS